MRSISPTLVPTRTSSDPPPAEDLVLDAGVAIKWYIPEVLAAEAR